MEMNEYKDSFSIGSAASGVNIHVYFDILDDDVIAKIDKAIDLWKKASITSGRVK